MEMIGGLLLLAAQDWTTSLMQFCHDGGTLLGGSEDAILFYDVRNPARPKYLGKMSGADQRRRLQRAGFRRGGPDQ
ncbi:MAG: hypothetical protein ABI831_15455 [Betaproteobacteria bacterium]